MPLSIAERQAGKVWIPIFIVFAFTRSGIEPQSTVLMLDVHPLDHLSANNPSLRRILREFENLKNNTSLTLRYW